MSTKLTNLLGLALLASLADARTRRLREDGVEALAALNGGYHLAFFLGACLTSAAALLGAVLLRPKAAGAASDAASAVAAEEG